jgi:lipoprotein NlpI
LFPNKKYSNTLLLFIIATFTLSVHFNSLNNNFQENWDDDIYITKNASLQSPKNGYVKEAFTTFSNGHYHPLTTLSYAADYKLFGLQAKPFHATNLVIHLLATFMVFAFIYLLTKEQFIAFFVALLFGIHPMHVESVAWISDRKDLLCTLFYTGALCTYLLYLKNKDAKQFFFTFILFVLALLSKSMAITLPFVLLFIDYYRERKISLKVILEKIPFLILSLIFGYVSILAQKENDALGDPDKVSFLVRIIYGCYALIMYIVRLFYFGDISAFYNYPLMENGKLPLIYYLMPVFVILLFFSLYKIETHRKLIFFGFGFFLISISLVLQFIPAGNVIMADRYTYLPYIGLFFVIGILLDHFYKRSGSLRLPLLSLVLVYFGLSAMVSYSRTKVWKDSMTLWSDVIGKNPDAALPYNNRAALFIERKEYEKAITDLNRAIQIRPKYVTPHYNRGVMLSKMGRYNEAIRDFDFVLQNDPKDVVSVYIERGNAHLFNRNYPKAIEDLSSALKYEPNSARVFYFRGMCYHSGGRYAEALNDFNNLLRLDPNYARAYFLRALTLYKLQDYNSALQDALKAQQMGYKVDPDFIQELNDKRKV